MERLGFLLVMLMLLSGCAKLSHPDCTATYAGQSARVKAMLTDEKGNRWIKTEGNSLFLMDRSGWHQISKFDEVVCR